MSLFDGIPMDFNKKPWVVLSASRMTDMPRYYPDELIEEVNKRINRGMEIHTLVLWTKHPMSLFKQPLYHYLLDLKNKHIQLFIQLTITGMGSLVIGKKGNGKPLIIEPHAPAYRESLEVIPRLIDLVGQPERIRLRVDPIVRIVDGEGKVFSNIKYLPIIISAVAPHGVKNFSFSFLEQNMHNKVDKRFSDLECKILSPSYQEREKFTLWIKKLEQEYGVTISACCVPGFEDSKCIDGKLLERLHDLKSPVNLTEPRKRAKCGCTHSIDIGGWPPKKCYTGCDYCYAR